MDPLASELLPRLLERCRHDLDAMRRALGEGKLDVVYELGHRMAGACGTFGQEQLAELGRRLERAAKAGDARAIAPVLDQIAARLESRAVQPAPEPAPPRLDSLRVLLLEDDPLQQELAASWLRDAGFRVVTANSGVEAMRALQGQVVDMAILDWMVPEMTGEQLLRWIRGHQPSLPVLFATSRDDDGEIASILELGADDYVVKPLRRVVFMARLAALARRAGLAAQGDQAVIELGPYRLDPRSRTVSLEGRHVKMTPRMTEVALLLFRRRGEIVTRAMLYEEVWAHRQQLDTRSVDTHVSRLRQALELDGRHGWKLTAVYQHGYRLEEAPPAAKAG